MSTFLRNRMTALAVAGALAIGLAVSSGPVFAGPVLANTAALKQALPGDVIDVQWRRRGAGPWIAGAALGIAGAVIANEAYRDRYYDNGYGYGYGQYPAEGYYGGYAPYQGYAPYRGGYAPYGTCDNGAVC